MRREPMHESAGPPLDGRERLLRAAVRHLEGRSAASLRVTAIADEAEVALGLIRHHFGSRDGLVAAAQQRRIAGATKDDIAGVREVLSGARDLDTVLARLERVARVTLDRGRAATRLSRFAAIATAHGRPDVRDAIGSTLSELVDEMAALIDEAQQEGVVARELDPRALATFIQAYSLGLLLHDLDPARCDDDALLEVIMVAVRAILSPA
jgi:AcrR family transcriptional regulator